MADFWGPAAGGYQLMARVTYTQDYAANTSTVRSIIYLVVPQWVSTSSAYFGHVIAGVTKMSTTVPATYAAGTHVVMDNTQVVPHNADGTGSVTIAASVQDMINGFFNVSVSVNTMTLATIPRATSPSFSGSFTTGAAKTISLPRASSSFTHDVTYRFGSASGTIATGAGVTASWTPPHSLLTQIPNSATGTGTITVTTKSGGTVVGTKSATFTLAAASSIIPTVSAVTWDDANTTVKNTIGAFVQGLSQVKGAVTAAGIHGSTIKTLQTVIEGKTVTAGATVVPQGSGTVAASGRATDSRGRVGTRAASITVLPYTPPEITKFDVYRVNASNVADDTGTRLYAKLSMAVTSLLVGGTEKNKRSYRISTRTGTGDWVQRNTYSGTILSTVDGGLAIGGGAVYLESQSYDLRLEVWDALGQQVTAETTVPTSAVALDLNGTNVGVGKYWEKGALDVAGDIHTPGRVHTPYLPYSMAAGVISVSHPASTANVTGIVVTLPVARFTQAPIVTANLASGSGGAQKDVVRAYSSDTTSVTLGIWTGDQTASNVAHTDRLHWQAVQMTEGTAEG